MGRGAGPALSRWRRSIVWIELPLSSPRRRGPITTVIGVSRGSCNGVAGTETTEAMGPRLRADDVTHCIAATLMPVGPRITTNSTGRKNRIIGTVSFGGSAAAFFSASFMRMSRFSCAITRRLVPSGVP
jgi:hypothetical protein